MSKFKTFITVAAISAIGIAVLSSCSVTSNPNVNTGTEENPDVRKIILDTKWQDSGESGAELSFRETEAALHAGGNDGCNSGGSDVVIKEDNSIAFSGFMSTMMWCEDVETWLFSSSYGELSEDRQTITMFSEDGKVVGELLYAGAAEALPDPVGDPNESVSHKAEHDDSSTSNPEVTTD